MTSTSKAGREAGVANPSPTSTSWFGLRSTEWLLMIVPSLLILSASYLHWWSIGVEEAWGFVTGGICVWLVVREHLWNWPIGLANNAVFFVLFLHGRLFADMSLQVIYIFLGVYGWWNWVYGGTSSDSLKISHAPPLEWWVLAVIGLVSTLGIRQFLLSINDAAPLIDSLSTVLSLIAQYLLCRKRLENWWVWIAADLIYVPLYFSRHLPLTAILYGVFLVMCLVGVREWQQRLRQQVITA